MLDALGMKLTFFSAEAMVLELSPLPAVVTDMMLESSAHVRTLCMGIYIYVAVGAVYSKVDWDYIYILLQLLIFCYLNAHLLSAVCTAWALQMAGMK